MIRLFELLVVQAHCLQGVLIPGPGTAGHTHHGIPGHGHAQNGIHPLRTIQHHAEAAVDGLANAHAAAVVQRHQAHTPGAVTGVALDRHIGHDVGAVFDVGGLPEGGVGAAGVVMIPAQHDGAHLTVADHFVELQGNLHPAQGVLVQDAALGAHHQLVFLGVPDPDVVVPVLIAPVGIDAAHSGGVGFVQILGLPRQAAPAEGAVAVVEQLGTQNVLHIGGEHEALQIVLPVFANLLHTGVKDGLEEAVAIVKEVGAPVVELTNHLIVMG